MTKSVVITDTSVLINFLVLDQLHVLSQLTEFDFSVTEHVRAEITEHFPEQLQRLNAAFEAGSINEICVTDIVEVRLFAELTTQGLGIGECSAVAVALNRGIRIAIDDKREIKKIMHLFTDSPKRARAGWEVELDWKANGVAAGTPLYRSP
jgi:predicted nucleic acid-binding protein